MTTRMQSREGKDTNMAVEADKGCVGDRSVRWYRVGTAVTNNRQTAAAWASDRLGPGKVEVLESVDGPVLESWAWLGKRNGRDAWAMV